VRVIDLLEEVPDPISGYPFSFVYGGKPSGGILPGWKRERCTDKLDADRTKITTVFTDPKTGLRVTWEAVSYSDFPAAEWLLWFENTGAKDTEIIQGVQALDLGLWTPMPGDAPFILHKTKGSVADATDFEYSTAVIDDKRTVPGFVGGPVFVDKRSQTLTGGGRGSSGKDFPFFKIDTGEGSLIVAVGWSGQWRAVIESNYQGQLHLTAGQELTNFKLHPGERVRSPRMLVLFWPGETWQSNAEFRKLVYTHYAAVRNGQKPLPIPFCNTCFTRDGIWLNECNEENQISLIKGYAKLGIEVILTDAGWFEGGWPAGAGNWTPRKDAYPNGMAPVAATAKENNMIYGLWFEPERVFSNTALHKAHPEWCLYRIKAETNEYLLNFGLKEAQDYFFDIVKGFMGLPGFRVYRQDFNMDPLRYWRFNDAPDRQGVTEMKYIEGLYAYWDRLAETWPDALREECASGGMRIDLETVMRMHIHQKTDHWFDDEADQGMLWSLSQYLPNNCIVAHLNNLDDYSFHSTLASSLCLGWIADDPGFDLARGRELLGRYREVRHLLIGEWYPLLPYSRDLSEWIAAQYHRADLDEGIVLAFRRAECPYSTIQVRLHGLDADATYELAFDSSGEKARAGGAELMDGLEIAISERHKSELMHYRRVK
jgi:alpha-galactosidase